MVKFIDPIAFTPALVSCLKRWSRVNYSGGSKHKIFDLTASGFRKGQSCHDNLLNLTITVQIAFRENKDVFVAFLDVRGAFDNVNIKILLDKLANIGCPHVLVKFISFITSERYVYTDVNSDAK